ncbi:MAG: hypothetical protein RL173_1008 [Fibrobacterota bacterium]|jgi:peptidoglycan/LPS O-acetylase OafA/YrhL
MSDTTFSPSSEESSKGSNHFDLLRLILAVLVMLSHAPELLDGNRSREILTSIFQTLSFGEFAVNCFFLLSGYLICKSWMLRPEPISFLRNRMLRILPGYVVAFLASIFIAIIWTDNPNFLRDLDTPSAALRLLLLKQPPAVAIPGGSPHPEINGPLWSIEFEMRCYLLVLLLGTAGLLRHRCTLPLIACTSLGFLLFFPFTSASPSWPTKAIFSAPADCARLSLFFAVGGIFWIERKWIKRKGSIALISLGVLAACTFSYSLYEVALATAGAYVLFWLALTPNRIFEWLRPRIDLSYGIYLYGWPAQRLVYWRFPGISPWLGFGLALLLVIPFALLSWKFVESPFLRMKATGDASRRLIQS